MVEQPTAHLQITQYGRLQEWSGTEVILRVNVCAALEQPLDSFNFIFHNQKVKSCLPKPVARMYDSAILVH